MAAETVSVGDAWFGNPWRLPFRLKLVNLELVRLGHRLKPAETHFLWTKNVNNRERHDSASSHLHWQLLISWKTHLMFDVGGYWNFWLISIKSNSTNISLLPINGFQELQTRSTGFAVICNNLRYLSALHPSLFEIGWMSACRDTETDFSFWFDEYRETLRDSMPDHPSAYRTATHFLLRKKRPRNDMQKAIKTTNSNQNRISMTIDYECIMRFRAAASPFSLAQTLKFYVRAHVRWAGRNFTITVPMWVNTICWGEPDGQFEERGKSEIFPPSAIMTPSSH